MASVSCASVPRVLLFDIPCWVTVAEEEVAPKSPAFTMDGSTSGWLVIAFTAGMIGADILEILIGGGGFIM